MTICLLCCENGSEFMSLSSENGKQLKVATVLFKHFPFILESKSCDGEICRACWNTVESFHAFYIRIEEIQLADKKEPIVVMHDASDLKLESESNDFSDFEFPEANVDWSEINGTFLEDTHPTKTVQVDKVKKEPSKKISKKCDTSKLYHKVKNKFNKLIYECDLCKTSFSKIINLKQHMIDSHSVNHQCHICDKILLNEKTLKTHIQSFHAEMIPVIERKPTKKRQRTKKYKSPESEFKTIQCNICLEYFLTDAQLEKHRKLKHFLLPFKCTHIQCPESFETPELLAEHRKNDHAKVQCPQCPKKVSENLLDVHIDRMHNKSSQTICEQCGKVFSNGYAHKYHIRLDHGNPERLQCDMCKGWFKDKYNLQKHMKFVHLEGPAVCTLCGKISPNSKALRAHMLIHKKPTMECLVCGKTFRHSAKLRKEHSYIHTGFTDAYECNFCGKKFRFGSSWSAHRMKYHPNEMAETKDRMDRLKNNASQKMNSAENNINYSIQ